MNGNPKFHAQAGLEYLEHLSKIMDDSLARQIEGHVDLDLFDRSFDSPRSAAQAFEIIQRRINNAAGQFAAILGFAKTRPRLEAMRAQADLFREIAAESPETTRRRRRA